MAGDGRVRGRVAEAHVLVPPGRYGDGPVHIRVEGGIVGLWRPPADYEVELNDWRCRWDPKYDYVAIENSLSAFLYAKQMIERGVPAAGLSVVRLADTPI